MSSSERPPAARPPNFEALVATEATKASKFGRTRDYEGAVGQVGSDSVGDGLWIPLELFPRDDENQPSVVLAQLRFSMLRSQSGYEAWPPQPSTSNATRTSGHAKSHRY